MNSGKRSPGFQSVPIQRFEGGRWYPRVDPVVEERVLRVVVTGTVQGEVELLSSPWGTEALVAGALFREWGVLPWQWRVVTPQEEEARGGDSPPIVVDISGNVAAVGSRSAVIDPTSSVAAPTSSANLTFPSWSPQEVFAATERLATISPVHKATGGVHIALYVSDEFSVSSIDISRHSAIDRLIGSLLLRKTFPWPGIIALSCRVTAELLHRASIVNAPLIASVSAPTAEAIDSARQSGITLCGFVRGQRLNLYTHADRLLYQDTAIPYDDEMEKAPATKKKILGGVPAHIVLTYLKNAPGAVPSTDGDSSTARGDGWECTVRQLPPKRHGSLSIGQIEVSAWGEEEIVEQVFEYLMPLVMRGGA